MACWLGAMIAAPLAHSAYETLFPKSNAPAAMAAYLDEHVALETLIETWEPEMSFLTDHRYHHPPGELLPKAVSQAFLGGAPASSFYDYVAAERPQMVLVGWFSKAVSLYPADVLAEQYTLVTQIGDYELYERGR